MSLAAYTERRLRAPYHVQVKFNPDLIQRESGIVPVQGEVVTKFRGDDKLSVGDEVCFAVALYHNRNEVFLGAWSWTHIDEFNEAEFLEVFLDGDPPNCGVHDYSVLLIDAPSTSPRANVPTEKELSDQLAEWEAHNNSPTLLERLQRWLCGI
ncbi:hypothetical protein [Vacuolonema iberomarrocanum]|uniref:hypothetical protein n=1 Tax=Vacuolonema iberomarrocanum TaxID=3454632 RepID=UPI0019DA1C29|nr:hypothetical protein [filamentous cyanobacterium LEGE 07170]